MENKQGEWKCNFCNKTDEVTNGYCKGCGPTQTTPIDNRAKKIAGVFKEEKEKK